MSPQPIDPNTMVGRLAIADRVIQATERQGVVHQERLAAQAPAQSTESETQVQETKQTEQEPVREREPSGEHGRRRKKRTPGESATEAKETAPAESATEAEETAPDTPTYNLNAEAQSSESDEGQILDVQA